MKQLKPLPDSARLKPLPESSTRPLRDAFKAVLPAISKDLTRINLCHAYVQADGKVVATDGHRLHMAEIDPRDAPLKNSFVCRPIVELATRSTYPHFRENVLVVDHGRWDNKDDYTFPPYHVILNDLKPGHSVTKTRKQWLAETERRDVGNDRAGFTPCVILGPTAINESYFKDALKACGPTTCEITITTTGELDPVRFECDGFFALVMPVRG